MRRDKIRTETARVRYSTGMLTRLCRGFRPLSWIAPLVLAALPVGLLFGRGLATFIITQLRTETVRLPLKISLFTYSLAVLVVLGAALASFAVVSRMLKKLDMIAVLKARE